MFACLDEVLRRLEPLLLEELREVALDGLGGQCLCCRHLVSSVRRGKRPAAA